MVPTERILRITFDPDADAAYVYLQPPTALQPSVAQRFRSPRT
jgi:uncharacterized protein YuzE